MKARLRILTVAVLGAFAVYAASAALPGTEPLAKLIIHEFDKNTDDIVNAGEWLSGLAKSFGKIDVNDDNSLHADEVDSLKKDLTEKTGEVTAGLIVALVKQLLMTLDSNGDKLVSLKEYDTLSTNIFTKLDTDKGNSLSLAEISELPVKMIAK